VGVFLVEQVLLEETGQHEFLVIDSIVEELDEDNSEP
jgi:hypothetical protein